MNTSKATQEPTPLNLGGTSYRLYSEVKGL
jgi:hypothetical protein